MSDNSAEFSHKRFFGGYTADLIDKVKPEHACVADIHMYLLCAAASRHSARSCTFVKSSWIFATFKCLHSTDTSNFPNLCGCEIVLVSLHLSSVASGSVTGAGLLHSAKLSALLFIVAPI